MLLRGLFCMSKMRSMSKLLAKRDNRWQNIFCTFVL